MTDEDQKELDRQTEQARLEARLAKAELAQKQAEQRIRDAESDK